MKTIFFRFAAILIMSIFLFVIAVGCDQQASGNTDSNNKKKHHFENGKVFAQFVCKDLDGKLVTNKIFDGYKITMIHIWSPSCPDSLEELPELQALYTELKPLNVNIIGILAQGKFEEIAALSKVRRSDIKYPNLIASDSLNGDYFNKTLIYFPTTVFVDHTGCLVGSAIVGGKTKDEYMSVIKNLLTNI